MQSDTDLITSIRDFIQTNPTATFFDIRVHFDDTPSEKLLYILNQILVSP